jgi:hypothetical protein
MPEVRFDDVLIAKVIQSETTHPIDPRFVEVCEPNSIEVCGTSSDEPVMVGASIHNDAVQLRIDNAFDVWPVRVVIRLTGIRKGFRHLRFPDRTQEEFDANERFIQSAYPGEGTQ